MSARCFSLVAFVVAVANATEGLQWEFDAFGSIISHACGTSECEAEADYLAEELQSNACAGEFQHKVTLVLDGGNINDGTFNQLAYEGAIAACTSENACCLEVDSVDDDEEEAEIRFMCELEYAAQDSDLSIGVGFLHEMSVHRAGTCVPDKKFAIVDVAYFGTNALTNTNIEGLTFADNEAGYLAGVIAGGVAASGTKKLGVIGGLPIPPVVRFIDGFINGSMYACPDCTATAIYCPFGGAAEEVTGEGYVCPGEFADIEFGVNIAKYYLRQGVDVIFGAGGPTGSSGIKYASAPAGTFFNMSFYNRVAVEKTESKTPYVVGVDQDEYYTTFADWPGSSKLITSALKRVDVGVSTAISNYLSDTGFGRNLMLNATNGGVGFAVPHETSSNAPYFGPVTPPITAAASEVLTAMALGAFSTSTTAPQATPGSDNAGMIIAIAVAAILLITCMALLVIVMSEVSGKPIFKPRGSKIPPAETGGVQITVGKA